MQNWEYTFPPTSKEDWIRQIEKDLKGKTLESLNNEWWPGEPLVPFHHASDSYLEPIALPDDLFAAPPQIVEAVDTNNQSAVQVNGILLEALQYGTQSFLIQPDHRSPIDFNVMMGQIFPDMIDWHIYANDQSPVFFESMWNLSPQTTYLRFPRSAAKTDLKTMLDNQRLDPALIPAFKFEYHFLSSGNWIENASQIFLQLLEDLRQWEKGNSTSSFFQHCILQLDADVHYFKQVIQTRVLHLIWLNLCREYSGEANDKVRYLECHITPKAGESPEHYLISASLSSLAAFLTGTSSLCIRHLQTEGLPDFYKRIDRNIHHLLHLESNLQGAKDPLAGAYTVDYYTKRWTERIWSQIFEE